MADQISPLASAPDLVFLKLGGSLITDKFQPRTLRPQVLARLAEEIASARRAAPALRLLLGHGSGSFGHVPASSHRTRQGVHSPADWQGFVEVWRQASGLNRLVMEALQVTGLPAMAFPPSASVVAEAGRVLAWELGPLRAALEAGLLPVVYGDVVFDAARGGTILSTEDLFAYLSRQLRPRRLLLAGLERGVWADYPACTRLISELTQVNLAQAAPALRGSAATDVTGGMASKVHAMLDLLTSLPDLEILIFSGQEPGAVRAALLGAMPGTTLRGSAPLI
jgi:isopentenyl phosphate kinase